MIPKPKPYQKNPVQKLWVKTRKKWMVENQPNFQGYYKCQKCLKWIRPFDMELHHIIKRSERPDLRYELSNLEPLCLDCHRQIHL